MKKIMTIIIWIVIFLFTFSINSIADFHLSNTQSISSYQLSERDVFFKCLQDACPYKVYDGSKTQRTNQWAFYVEGHHDISNIVFMAMESAGLKYQYSISKWSNYGIKRTYVNVFVTKDWPNEQKTLLNNQSSQNAEYEIARLRSYESFLKELQGGFSSIEDLIDDTRARLLADRERISLEEARIQIKNIRKSTTLQINYNDSIISSLVSRQSSFFNAAEEIARLRSYESFLKEIQGGFNSIEDLMNDTRARLLSDKEGLSREEALKKINSAYDYSNLQINYDDPIIIMISGIS